MNAETTEIKMFLTHEENNVPHKWMSVTHNAFPFQFSRMVTSYYCKINLLQQELSGILIDYPLFKE